MKKSFRSSKSSSSRPSSGGISKPRLSTRSTSKGISSRPMNVSKPSTGQKNTFGQVDNQDGFNKNQPFQTRQSGWRRRRTPLLVTLAVIFLCCLLMLCIAGVVILVNQGIISLPTT